MIYLNGLPINTTVFPDNTSQVWQLPQMVLDETNYAIVKWIYATEGEFLQLAQLKSLLDLHHIKTDLLIKYLPYGRQDKEVNNNLTFALRTFATLLNSLKFNHITIEDPHSDIALNLILNSKATYPTESLINALFQTKSDIICYPDNGAVIKYTKISNFPYVNFPYIYGEKVRDQLSGNITSYSIKGNVSGKNVLIVDDICDGGATFKILAKNLLASGASSVSLFVTHGIFSKGVRTLLDAGISRVFTADCEVFARHNEHNI